MSGATLSRERFLLECAKQERLDREQTHVAPWLTRLLAAARREGEVGMRERAAREARYWTASQKVADRILALPLTPEEL